MNKIQDAEYREVFPENLKKYNNLKQLSLLIERKIKEGIVSSIEKLAVLGNLEVQEDIILDEIAWWFNLDDYQTALSRETKIKLIKSAYAIHSKKGTKSAVEEQLDRLDYKVSIQEWFEYGGDPYTFRLILKKIKNIPGMLQEIINLINTYKNVRSHLEFVILPQNREEITTISAYKSMIIVSKKENRKKDFKITFSTNAKAYKQMIGVMNK